MLFCSKQIQMGAAAAILAAGAFLSLPAHGQTASRAEFEAGIVQESNLGTGMAVSAEVSVGTGHDSPSGLGQNEIYRRQVGFAIEGQALHRDGEVSLRNGELTLQGPGGTARLGSLIRLDVDNEAYFRFNDSLGTDYEGGVHAGLTLTAPDVLGGHGPVQLQLKLGATTDAGARDRNDDVRAFLRLGLKAGAALCIPFDDRQQRLCAGGEATGEAGLVEARATLGAGLGYEVVLSDERDSARSILFLNAGTEWGAHSDPTGSARYRLTGISGGIAF